MRLIGADIDGGNAKVGGTTTGVRHDGWRAAAGLVDPGDRPGPCFGGRYPP
ncbi:hypothetical protein [Burkholderia catarinensis]|uniref:hypothetical protein n=1 Tax=Burkholderia catarinensis TaxID=1108140 RepID=UPI001300E07E|nr:hypothetical protein [Burkholderia catarinensis]